MNRDAAHAVAPALVGGALGQVRHPQGVALHLTGVRFGFPTRPDFLGPVDCTVRGGDAWAIIGPNGAGKSTLLRLMAGLTQPAGGDITWMGRSLSTMSARDRASTIALLPQRAPSDLDLRVGEIVLMGRFPHRAFGLFESAEDHRIAERALMTTQVTAFADRLIATLSGGEAQRVHLAAALAQEPRLLLLDEPTASLDLEHQLAIFSILRDRARNDGLAVVIVTHDVNLAARFCDKVLLLSDGKVVACGPPREVVTPAILEPVYGVRLAQLQMPGGEGDWIVPSDNMAALSV